MASIKQEIVMLPVMASWADWNGDFLHYFGEQPLPMVDETQWQDLAYAVNSLPTFNNYALPDPATFEDWQSWASELVLAVNGSTI